MIDSHCHLTFDVFQDRVDAVIADARAAGVRGMISVSTTTGNCRDNLAIAKANDNIWCSAGVHPLHADEQRDWSVVREVAIDPKCVAWGELGLDNHYDKPPKSVQLEVLAEQLDFLEACKSDGIEKPIIIHCREAFDELIPILNNTSFDSSRFVFHCFTGSVDEARAVLEFGAWISFTGIVTFKNASNVGDAAKLVPRDRIMVETDAPFLSPDPVRKIWPCEPKFVMHTGRFIANLRGEDETEFEQLLDGNTCRFFDIEIE